MWARRERTKWTLGHGAPDGDVLEWEQSSRVVEGQRAIKGRGVGNCKSGHAVRVSGGAKHDPEQRERRTADRRAKARKICVELEIEELARMGSLTSINQSVSLD